MIRIAEIIRALVRYGDRGGGAYHAISNQIWLWNMALTLAMIPLIGVLFVLYGELLAEQRWGYLAAYISVPVGIAAIQVVLFWIGNRPASPPAPLHDVKRGASSVSFPASFSPSRLLHGMERGPGGEAARRTLALHLLIFSDCAMIWLFSLLIGAAGGIHLIFPAALALPFYFFRREIQARAWLTKAIWVGVIVGQFALAVLYLSDVVAWRPLPTQVTQTARVIIVALAALISVIWVVYFWWQLGLTKRIVSLWQKIRMNGVQLFPKNANPTVIRDKIQQSTILGMLTGVSFAIFLFQAILCLHFMWETGKVFLGLRYLTVHGLPSILTFSLSTLAVYAQGKTKSERPIVYVFILAVFFIFTIGIINSAGSSVYLAHCGILPFPILLLFRPKKKLIAGLLTMLISLSMIVNILFLEQYGPIFPFPAKYDLAIRAYVLLGTFFSIVTNMLYMKGQTNIADEIIQEEKSKTESLLLNILPEDVAEELKLHGFSAPREYSSTTVLFTDFVGFTRIAEKLTAVDLVRELDQCFSYFDNVAHKYGLEKLKTIGDAYMAAGGIPVENNTHPIDCALAALEIQSFMNQMKEIKEQQGFPYWELRLGMHTGPLVAGVVGEKKFAYDVWGDTVNTASRMESSGEPGAINISRELYDRLRFLFVCAYRGKVYAKNKGEIEMYFLRGLKPKFSIGGVGRVPNAEFKEIYEKIKAGARLVSKSK